MVLLFLRLMIRVSSAGFGAGQLETFRALKLLLTEK